MELNTIKILSNIENVEEIMSLNLNLSKINGILDLSNIPFKKLLILNCSGNKITELKGLPQTLRSLYCINNQLTTLDNLPCSLFKIVCTGNKIEKLDNLPLGLQYLECCFNSLKSLDFLPSNLTHLRCDSNKLESLDNLPVTLKNLSCSTNPLLNLSWLPPYLETLESINVNTNYLTVLPETLIRLEVDCKFADKISNQLLTLPKKLKQITIIQIRQFICKDIREKVSKLTKDNCDNCIVKFS